MGYMWWSYFNIQRTEKYSIAMCYLHPGQRKWFLPPTRPAKMTPSNSLTTPHVFLKFYIFFFSCKDSRTVPWGRWQIYGLQKESNWLDNPKELWSYCLKYKFLNEIWTCLDSYSSCWLELVDSYSSCWPKLVDSYSSCWVKLVDSYSSFWPKLAVWFLFGQFFIL